MKTVAIIDARESFLADISTRIMVEDSAEFDLVATSSSPEDITKIINRKKPDEIVVSENILRTQPDWEYGVTVTSYAQTADGINLADNYGLKSYGIITRTDELIEVINKGLFKNIVPTQKPASSPVQAKPEHVQKAVGGQSAPSVTNRNGSLPVLDMDFGDSYEEKPHYPTPNQSNNEPIHREIPPVQQNPVYQQPNNYNHMNGGIQQGQYTPQYPNQQQPYPNQQNQNQGYRVPVNNGGGVTSANTGASAQTVYRTNAGAYVPPTQPPVYSPNPVQQPWNQQSAPSGHNQQYGGRMPNIPQDNSSLVDRMVEEDIRQKNRVRNTKVVSFYAAKGGVGKTTLSSEVAVYLSLMNNGRRNNRVCIVDYNIDFGDVLTTLYLDSNGKNMLYWADDIADRLKSGEPKKNITYTREEIESFLQVMDSCGLYALVAPVNHEDSMGLTEDQLEIMLNNLILFGDFDYIVCDTGNNTRDSTILALDNSDMVFLVVTQDVTTANCNSSFLQAVNQVGFDLDKIRLIINDIMPYKDTGISVKELEDNFPNYPCVARIKHNPDVVKANNLGKPLTFNPAHEYTKELRGIVQHITGVIPEKQEKTGFLNKLLKGFKR